MQYILTESNHLLGLKGMLIAREEYIAVPYYDRALFQIAQEESEYAFQVVADYGNKEVKYFIRHAMALEEWMDETHLDRSVAECFAQLKKHGKYIINLPLISYTFTKTP
jgi:hypothetical protein